MVGHLHAGDLITHLGFTRDCQDMIALSLIQVYQQNVYFFDTHEVRVEDERRFALMFFQGWYRYAGELMAHVKARSRHTPLHRELASTFTGELPQFCHTLDAKKGFRI